MAKVIISKGATQSYINALLNQVQALMKGKTLDKYELGNMQEELWRIEHYINQDTKPEPKPSVHMMSCATTRTGFEEHCNCKDWQEGEM